MAANYARPFRDAQNIAGPRSGGMSNVIRAGGAMAMQPSFGGGFDSGASPRYADYTSARSQYGIPQAMASVATFGISDIATGIAQTGVRAAGESITARASLLGGVSGDPAGEALQGVVGELTKEMKSFVNVFTMPNLNNIANFFQAMAEAPARLVAFGDALLDSKKNLSKLSGAFAAIDAIREVGSVRRGVSSAAATGSSAIDLTKGLEDLKDTLRPIQDEVFNLTAGMITDLVPLMKKLLKKLEPFIALTMETLPAILNFLVELIFPLIETAFDLFLSAAKAIVDALEYLRLINDMGEWWRRKQNKPQQDTTATSFTNAFIDLNRKLYGGGPE